MATVTLHVLLSEPLVAVITVVPVLCAVTTPFSTVATPSSAEVHKTGSVLPSTVAVMVAEEAPVSGSNSMLVLSRAIWLFTTVTLHVLLSRTVALPFFLHPTVIVAVPALFAVTRPPETEATASSEDDHVNV